MNAASTGKKVTGSCLCGAVRISAEPHGGEFGVCHCSICRHWTAGPFLAVECSKLAVEDHADLGLFRSSEWAERGFCRKCGTPLFYRMLGNDLQAVSLEALDDRNGYAFASQIFIDEKPDYYEFANFTKTMTGAEVFASFGASGGSDGQ